MFTQPVASILYCYGVYQDFHIIVLDDLMEKIVKSIEMQEHFTKYCHHRNMTAIIVSPNVFQKGPNTRTISLNTHIHVLFANKRDEVKVSVLVHQLFHSKMKKNKFLSMYNEHMKQHFAYLGIDCAPQYPSKIKVCTDIFPGQLTYTFDI